MSKSLLSYASSSTITLILICVALVWVAMMPYAYKPELPGENIPIQHTVALKPEDPKPTYASNPPSSGAYKKTDTRGGIHTSTIPDEQLVYLLLQGWVAIQYNCQYKAALPTLIPLNSDLSQETTSPQNARPAQESGAQSNQLSPLQTIDQINMQNAQCGQILEKLRTIVEKKGEDKLVMYRNPKLDSAVAAVAWGKLEKQEILNERVISKFIDYYRGRDIK